MYIAMLLDSGMSFDETRTLTIETLSGIDIDAQVAPSQLSHADFFDTSPGRGFQHLAKSFAENGVMSGDAQNHQLALAREIFLDTATLTMHRVREVQKETGQILLPKPGLSSGNIEPNW